MRIPGVARAGRSFARAALPGFALGLSLALAPIAAAGTADVLAAKVTCRPAPGGRPASVCHFSVTVKHADTGWDHFADRYDILGPDGRVLATRALEHPHVEEQPFTRGIGQVRIQWAVTSVEIRANDSVHGLGGRTLVFEIPHAKSDAPPPAPPAP
jgi:hypothetical protein